MKVLALNMDGTMSFCVASEEDRGRGRCNHIAHKMENETTDEFVERISQSNLSDANIERDVPDQKEFVMKAINYNKVNFNENPNWEEAFKKRMKNYFQIGTGDNYEKAELEKLDQVIEENEEGDKVVKLTAHFTFRGESYELDMGEIPYINEDGTFEMNGIRNRCLPILSQNKEGAISNQKSFIVKKEDGGILFSYNRETDTTLMGGREVDINEIIKELNGEKNKLNQEQKYFISKIDPIVFERFPDFKSNLKDIVKNTPVDEPNDLSWRKVLTYEEQVGTLVEEQFKRMGNTFRTNLVWNTSNPDKDPRPLFYQKNLTDNIRKSLLGKSNVQLADDVNAITALSQSHKISLTGEGGFNKDKVSRQARDIHETHRDVVDSLDVSLGKNIGLTLTLNCGIDERGFIKKRENKEDRALVPSDFMPYRKYNDINRAMMFSAHIRQACPIVGGEDPRKVGDDSDKSWEKISGSKIGVNLNVAYIPMPKNFEDSIVVSESAAKKMKTFQNYEYRFKEGNTFTVPEGTVVKKGDILGGKEIRQNGIVVKSKAGKMIIREEYPFTVGDKIAGRHGNKGVCGEIRPDHKMPKIKKEDTNGNITYEPVQIAMSPLAVTGRINLGQIYECNNGDLNKVSTVINSNGKKIEATAGSAFFMRLNHIAQKKLHSVGNEINSKGEFEGARIGSQERIIMSKDKNRLKILDYINNQETHEIKENVRALMKSVGVDIQLKEVDPDVSQLI